MDLDTHMPVPATPADDTSTDDTAALAATEPVAHKMFDNADMLARLMARSADDGQDLVALRAMVEEASDLGAARALKRLGLSDETARHDIAELRELLSAWRDAKSSMFKTALKWGVQWVLRGCLVLLLLLIALELGQLDLVR